MAWGEHIGSGAAVRLPKAFRVMPTLQRHPALGGSRGPVRDRHDWSSAGGQVAWPATHARTIVSGPEPGRQSRGGGGSHWSCRIEWAEKGKGKGMTAAEWAGCSATPTEAGRRATQAWPAGDCATGWAPKEAVTAAAASIVWPKRGLGSTEERGGRQQDQPIGVRSCCCHGLTTQPARPAAPCTCPPPIHARRPIAAALFDPLPDRPEGPVPLRQLQRWPMAAAKRRIATF